MVELIPSAFLQQPGLNEWQEGGVQSSTEGSGIWNDNEDFNELSQEANEALRGRDQ